MIEWCFTPFTILFQSCYGHGSHVHVSPREREVMGSIPGLKRPKSLKLVVVAFPLGTQDYGNSTTTGPPVSG